MRCTCRRAAAERGRSRPAVDAAYGGDEGAHSRRILGSPIARHFHAARHVDAEGPELAERVADILRCQATRHDELAMLRKRRRQRPIETLTRATQVSNYFGVDE